MFDEIVDIVVSEFLNNFKKIVAKVWEIYSILIGLSIITILRLSCLASDDDDYKRNHYENYNNYEEEKWSREEDYVGS